MTRRLPTLSCRRAALVEQMVLRLARKAAPFDREMAILVEAYDSEAEYNEWLYSIDAETLSPEVLKNISPHRAAWGIDQPVPEEPNWIKRLFARGNRS